MPLWPNFCAGAYQTQSSTIAADTCINLYLETTRNAADPKKAVLYGTPGQLPYTVGSDGVILPEVGCRGLFSQDGRVWGVVGGTFFEYVLAPPPTLVHLHPVANDGLMVTFASNGLGGLQLAVCSAGVLYILNLNTSVWTVVALPFVPVMVSFMDGYFLANEKDTPKMWFSNLFNGLTWSATDFFTRSSTSDNIVGFAVNNRRIWCLGSKTTEIFQDSGDATTPFIPYPGTVINEGTYSYASITSIADTVLWAGSTNEFGAVQIFAASGLLPQAISTPPISFSIAASTNTKEAEALAYTQGGHVFVCWTWPSIATTWCYDLTEQAWHRRSNMVETSPGSGVYTLNRWQARGCCAFKPIGAQPAVLVGQVDTQFLCQLSLDVQTDQQPSIGILNVIVRQRTAPYLSAENQWVFVQQIELGIDALAGGLPASDVQLLISGNNALTFGPPVFAGASLQMDGEAVAQWFQLGRYRADRLVLMIRQQVNRRCAWGPGLFVRLETGTGLL